MNANGNNMNGVFNKRTSNHSKRFEEFTADKRVIRKKPARNKNLLSVDLYHTKLKTFLLKEILKGLIDTTRMIPNTTNIQRQIDTRAFEKKIAISST